VERGAVLSTLEFREGRRSDCALRNMLMKIARFADEWFAANLGHWERGS